MRRALLLSLALALPGLLTAGAVLLPHAFENGTVADAEAVNANFAALEAAIDDNHARLSTVETKVAAPIPGRMFFIQTPANVRITCATTAQVHADLLPPNVPAGATAVLATITTFNSTRSDHVTHSFGRYAAHGNTTWDQTVYDANAYLNDVLITHNGDNGGLDYYGRSHGTQIIPLKANGRFDAKTCMGLSAGTHYITIQVYGYVL